MGEVLREMERTAAACEMATWRTRAVDAEAALAAAREVIEELRQALSEYGEHAVKCATMFYQGGPAGGWALCDCGLRAALAAGGAPGDGHAASPGDCHALREIEWLIRECWTDDAGESASDIRTVLLNLGAGIVSLGETTSDKAVEWADRMLASAPLADPAGLGGDE